MKDISVMIDDFKFNFRVCALIENRGRYLLERSDAVDFLKCLVEEFTQVRAHLMP